MTYDIAYSAAELRNSQKHLVMSSYVNKSVNRTFCFFLPEKTEICNMYNPFRWREKKTFFHRNALCADVSSFIALRWCLDAGFMEFFLLVCAFKREKKRKGICEIIAAHRGFVRL